MPAQFDSAYEFTDSRARVGKNGKWGFIDIKGKLAVPIKYDRAEDFYKGEAIVRRGKLWYKIDRFGKTTEGKSRKKPAAPKIDKSEAENLYQGLVPFTGKGGKTGYKNQLGQEVIKPQFDSGDYFTEGLARVGYVCTPPEEDDKKH